ncbi:retrovirus-related Pol polyprotein from transposon gypsy [Trichonephila clavipes]|nr:retrovirus-related Pol polyprotein from transposon gypsy [Trichonephila clavipes]
MGRLNILKVSDIKGDQTRSINQSPIKLSAICMSPVELPCVSILLDETITKAFWDTEAEKSFISEETYQKYFFYKQVKKSSTQTQKAFNGVKATFLKAPVLKFPDFKKPFELFTDASLKGLGAVLNQEQRPVVFASRTLSAAERNYTVTERECLAVVWALNKFRTYLGSLPIKVITDHASLTQLTTGKNLSNRMIRWPLKLAEFNIKWEHRPGSQNTIADVFSRIAIESIIGEKVNCAIIRDLVLSSRDQLIEEQKTNPELGHIYRYLENLEDSSINMAIWENWSRDFRLVEGLLFYTKYATSLGEMRVYIPKCLRNDIMREFHDKPLAGHFGRFKTYHKGLVQVPLTDRSLIPCHLSHGNPRFICTRCPIALRFLEVLSVHFLDVDNHSQAL